MPDIFKLASFDLARQHGQPRMFAFQGLHPGHFIGAHHRFAVLAQFGSFLINRIDVFHFFIKPFIWLRGQPVADQVWLDPPFFNSRAACRAEIVSTMPRCIISSAISRLVHWLIGRPAFSGFSHAIATIWQVCSAVIRAWPSWTWDDRLSRSLTSRVRSAGPLATRASACATCAAVSTLAPELAGDLPRSFFLPRLPSIDAGSSSPSVAACCVGAPALPTRFARFLAQSSTQLACGPSCISSYPLLFPFFLPFYHIGICASVY